MLHLPQTASDQATALDSLVTLLRRRVEQFPDRRLYLFLDEGQVAELPVTYAEFDRRVRAIAAHLQNLAAAGERALLLYPPGLDYIAGFFGCLYAGVIAVPAYPPNPARLSRTLPRLQAIIGNARPKFALTTELIASLAEGVGEEAPDLAALHWLATDTLPIEDAESWRAPAVGADTLAFLQYTSGSTGAPKGVMVSHGNLLANLAVITRGFEATPDDSAVFWLPPYHDMGLIGGLLGPIYIGVPCAVMSPLAFLQRPLRWLEAISRYRVTISGGPNFAYDLCTRKATPEQIAALDLSSWKLAFNGAEPIRADTLERFAKTFAPAGFRPEAFYTCYGLAEATLFVTGGERARVPRTLNVELEALAQGRAVLTRDAAYTLVSSGHPPAELRLVIADPERRDRCAADQIGEIWVAGPSIAHGYWDQPDETAHTFKATLTDNGDGPYLRTGDFGFVHEGELFVTGRLKDLIIVDGRNLYPQDIEATVEAAHPAIRSGATAAFSVDVNGEERVVAAAEVERNFVFAQKQNDGAEAAQARQELVVAVRRAVAEQHDVRLHELVLLKTGHIPKTSSGKIQRHACRAGYLARTLDLVEE
jgi:acyl-CoA synthetase (AMP-forming)/AMP-acid ligase II